jgi:hypothetical protein
MDEILLGFQLRVDRGQTPPWASDRRAKYLLIESVPTPLSVDTTVWPLSTNQALQSRMLEDYSTEASSAPNGLGVYRLQVALELLDRVEGSDPLAITALKVAADDLRALHKIEDAGYTVGDLSARGWRRLGYDVADRWLTSGLMNCGYNAGEKQSLVSRFGRLLNDNHLFREASDATVFSTQCDTRVAEHAPFFVYGLWLKG